LEDERNRVFELITERLSIINNVLNNNEGFSTKNSNANKIDMIIEETEEDEVNENNSSSILNNTTVNNSSINNNFDDDDEDDDETATVNSIDQNNLQYSLSSKNSYNFKHQNMEKKKKQNSVTADILNFAAYDI
jgi:hypothetical protein